MLLDVSCTMRWSFIPAWLPAPQRCAGSEVTMIVMDGGVWSPDRGFDRPALSHGARLRTVSALRGASAYPVISR